MFTFLKNKEGSIALPFLAVLLLFTITTLYFIDDYQHKQFVIKQATDAYLADILEEKYRNYALEMEDNTSKIIEYNIGTVQLEKSKYGAYVTIFIDLNTGFKRQVFVKIK
ncbi:MULTISPECIES: hypothetical protein [Enterococcaceae]|uniref:hypothetical protein n=1 Tax=Enterococcaceae TaxID=81852 RepID=UPI000E54F293|nr:MULTISPECIES: hypothetical protein [Enterococcaceae]MCI0130886.1 hypothetical protein [Vagococcus sp. CY53-2]RGI30267.1 hypothetical protein DXC12_06785 [Melissococcus sp. OM08-11BH]UNM89266.1 hypothetical protein MN187_08225 [Vagococcus sp. CY52-2]